MGKVQLSTGCAGAGAGAGGGTGVKSAMMREELRLRLLLSSMAFWLPWPPFSPLTSIRLSHLLSPSLLPYSAQTSASPKLPAISDPSLLRKWRRMCI